MYELNEKPTFSRVYYASQGIAIAARYQGDLRIHPTARQDIGGCRVIRLISGGLCQALPQCSSQLPDMRLIQGLGGC